MAEFCQRAWNKCYINQSVFASIFSRELDMPQLNEQPKDRPSRNASDEWAQAKLVLLDSALKKMADHHLVPVYQVTAVLALRHPRYQMNDLMRLIAEPDFDLLTSDEQETLEHTKKFIELLTDRHLLGAFDVNAYGSDIFYYDSLVEPDRCLCDLSKDDHYQLADDQLYQASGPWIDDRNDDGWQSVEGLARCCRLQYRTLLDLIISGGELKMNDLKFAPSKTTRGYLIPMIQTDKLQKVLDHRFASVHKQLDKIAD